MTNVQQEGLVLKLTRQFDAPREQVFDAWTNEDVLRQWWAAVETWEPAGAEVDLRPGGRYRLSMRNTDDGHVHTVTGEYTEIKRPERLAFTWGWEGEQGPATAGSEDTHVVVEFAEAGDGTEVTLTHTGFANEDIRAQHEHGWNGCLDNLERRLFAR